MANRLPSWEQIESGTKPSAEATLDALIKGDDSEATLDVTSTPVMSTTTSTNPERPRTLKAGYSAATKTMTVVFRDGTWWEYRNVPAEIWQGFKAASSKGQYLRSSGLDNWDDMGPANISKMPRAQRAQMNDLQAFVDYMYKS